MSRPLGSKLEDSKRARAAVRPIAGEPTKPRGLSAQASIEWDKIVAELSASGLPLTPAHRGLVTLAATLSADIRRCWATLEANGGDYTTAGTGAVKLHPAAARLDCLRRDLLKAFVALGLQKPKPDPAEDGEPSLEDFLNE